MTKYRVQISMNINAAPDDPIYSQSNSLWHSQYFDFEGENFGAIAPTIDGLYAAIRKVVEDNGGHSN